MAISGLFCSHCGQLNDAEAEFCSKCGAGQKRGDQAPAFHPPAASAPVAPVSVGGWQGMPSYQAATAAPAYDPTAATGFHGYGGFWIRVLAAIIDGAVTSAIVFPMIFILALAMGLSSAGSRQPNPAVALGFLAIWFPIALGIPWIYSAAMESSRHQATLGKMAVGLKVTDIYGARISFGRATGRHFGKVVSAIALYIGFIMVGFTERKQGLHDMIAGTVVLKK